MFGSIKCKHCGCNVRLDKMHLVDQSVLCDDCEKLGEGEICDKCFRYNLVTNVCSFDEKYHSKDGNCSILTIRVRSNKRKPKKGDV